ncbi:MAG: RluA family pseudouridine synthase [Oscillospiraceae bacterium]|nr:RluA family pseudouridine synthase [Oscillospiraceae bacterium]
MREFIFKPTESGLRIDKYISQELSSTRNAAVILIEGGNCLVNKRAVKKNYKINANDLIEVSLPPPETVDIVAQDIPLDIIFEDKELLVVNKPRGMVTHPAHGHKDGTLVNALLYHCGNSLSGINGELRPGIVHRLDMNTSGLLVVAKNDFAHNALAAQIKDRKLKREYEAVVAGKPGELSETYFSIDAPIGRDTRDRKKMTVTAKNSKSAVTHYKIIEQYDKAAHLRLRLTTGRTHQIRVHMAHIGHPVLGDDVYGNGKPKWLKGQCLHSRTIGFSHPRTGEELEFSAPLPEYFLKLLRSISS